MQNKAQTQNTTIQDDADELLASLSIGADMPDDAFVARMQGKFLHEDNSKSQYLNFNFFQLMKSFSKKTALAFGGSALAVFTIATLGVMYLNRPTLSPTTKSAEEIFAAIMEANKNLPINAIASRENLTASTDTASSTKLGAGSDEAMRIMPYTPEENTYSRYSSTVKAGPMFSKCAAFSTYQFTSTDSSTTYYNKDKGYLYKYEWKDENGQIIGYSLSDGEYTYDYAGGKYAVRFLNSQNNYLLKSAVGVDETAPVDPDTSVTNEGSTTEVDPGPDNVETLPEIIEEPIVDPGTEKPSFKEYFGEDAQVLGEETIDGKKYIVISYSYDGYCDYSNDSANSTKKMINKSWVDADTFVYIKTESYLNSISDGNLITSTSSSYENKVVDYSEIANEFTFTFSVSIKDIDTTINMPGSDEYTAALEKKLSTEGIQMIRPSDTSYRATGFTAYQLDLKDPFAFRLDKDFYANTSFGSQVFESNKLMYSMDYSNDQIFSVYFTNYPIDNADANIIYRSISMEAYAKGQSEATILKAIGYQDVAPQSFNMTLGTQTVAANLYQYTQKTDDVTTNSTEPGRPESTLESGVSEYRTYVVTYTLNDRMYVIRFDGNFTIDEIKSFKLDLQDLTNIQIVKQVIVELNKTISDNRLIAY